jgi:hypothetical protein
METVEHFARIALTTHILGRQQSLEQAEVDELVRARRKYLSVKSAAPMPVPSANGNGGRGRGCPAPRLPAAVSTLLPS